MTFAFVNGAQVPEETATISINDRGFRFGDGLFETVFVQDGLPYLWEYHMKRLEGGLEALRIPGDAQALLTQALQLLASNHVENGLLRIQVSRGAGSQGYLPIHALQPTIVMQTLAIPTVPAEPVSLWLSSHEKISPCALPTHYKIAQGLSSTLARMEAMEHECFDALQLAEGRYVSEASSSNIFWRLGNTLYTPSLACGALAGITRRRVMELSPYPVREDRYTLSDMATADAVILTNAALGAIAVGKLSPRENHWDSIALALEINALRARDIVSQADNFRKSLAQR